MPGAARQREDGLHAALAEGRLADDGGALLVLKRAGDELRSARGVLVDEDDARLARRTRRPPCAFTSSTIWPRWRVV